MEIRSPCRDSQTEGDLSTREIPHRSGHRHRRIIHLEWDGGREPYLHSDSVLVRFRRPQPTPLLPRLLGKFFFPPPSLEWAIPPGVKHSSLVVSGREGEEGD